MTLAYGILYIAIGIVGITLNLAVALAIWYDKSMKSATYTFMVQLALADLEAIVGIAGPGSVMLAGVHNSTNIFSKIFAYCGASGFRVAAFLMVFVSLTRWAYFSKHNALNSFFRPRNCKIICIVFWTFVHCWYLPFLICSDFFILIAEDSAAYAFTNSTIGRVHRYFEEYTCYGTGASQLIFNVMSIGLVLKMRKQVMTPELRAINSQEIKLLIQCGLDSLVFVLLIISVYYATYTGANDQWLGVTIEVLLLFNHFDCAIFYLCFNRKLRSFLIEFFKKKFSYTQSTTAVLAVNGRPA